MAAWWGWPAAGAGPPLHCSASATHSVGWKLLWDKNSHFQPVCKQTHVQAQEYRGSQVTSMLRNIFVTTAAEINRFCSEGSGFQLPACAGDGSADGIRKDVWGLPAHTQGACL